MKLQDPNAAAALAHLGFSEGCQGWLVESSKHVIFFLHPNGLLGKSIQTTHVPRALRGSSKVENFGWQKLNPRMAGRSVRSWPILAHVRQTLWDRMQEAL